MQKTHKTKATLPRLMCVAMDSSSNKLELELGFVFVFVFAFKVYSSQNKRGKNTNKPNTFHWRRRRRRHQCLKSSQQRATEPREHCKHRTPCAEKYSPAQSFSFSCCCCCSCGCCCVFSFRVFPERHEFVACPRPSTMAEEDAEMHQFLRLLSDRWCWSSSGLVCVLGLRIPLTGARNHSAFLYTVFPPHGNSRSRPHTDHDFAFRLRAWLVTSWNYIDLNNICNNVSSNDPFMELLFSYRAKVYWLSPAGFPFA